MKPPRDPDLELRGKLIRSLGLLREMLPGSFVERQRACTPVIALTANACTGNIKSPPLDGKPQALNIPAKRVEEVRAKIEMRRRFEAAAATICSVNLKHFLQEKLQEKEKEKEDRQI